ncbi:unnamed protein product, partial [Thlaspi arvense]
MYHKGFVVVMDERDVFVLCRWNGRIKKHGPNGIHYQGSTSRAIRVKRNTELIRLLDRLYLITGFDKRRSELRVTGRYPSAAGQSLKYVGLPLTNDRRLKIMLEAPMIHPCMIHVELYLQANRGGCFTHKKDLRVSSLWLDDREFRVGLRFKDEAEIKKAVDWLSIREERYCRAQETAIPSFKSVLPKLVEPDMWSGLRFLATPNSKDLRFLRFVVLMGEREVLVLCYWNGCIKYGPDGVYYEGSVPKKITVSSKTQNKQKSKLDIIGRYPVAVSPNLLRYVHLPVVNDSILKTMLEVPSKHPSVNSVELYLEVKPTPDDVIDPAACSSPLENPGSSSKRQRTQQNQEANGYVDTYVTHLGVKLERVDELEVQGVENNNAWTEDEANADKGLSVPGLEASANACVSEGVGSSAAKPLSLSSLWVDDHELRVGLRFKDRDELKKAVEWCSIRGDQKFVVQETEKDEYMFECIRWKCKWSLCAARMEEGGLVEITKYSGPHTCCPLGSENVNVELAAEEIECLIRVQPTVTVAELKNWWFEKFGYKLESAEMQAAKQQVIKKIYGDCDQSFRVLPNLMAALHSSNGLENPEARRWLDKLPPHQWTLAHDGGRRCGYTSIDSETSFSICESFQSPGLPVTATALFLFDVLRLNFQIGLRDSRGRLKRGDMYTKPVTDKLKEFTTASVTDVVMPLDNNSFQVTTPLKMNGWIVRLSDCTCTCGEFQSEKIPCLHALTVCEKLKINPLVYVDDCFTLERLHKTYASTFSPVPEVSAWPEACGVPTLFPPVIPPPPPPPTKVSGERKKSDTSPKASSKRKTTEEPTKEQSKSASKEKPVKEKGKDITKKPPPSDAELRSAIVDVLKTMDFKTATITDVLQGLADKFKIDLNSRKSSIKFMIEDEINKLANEAGDMDEEKKKKKKRRKKKKKRRTGNSIDLARLMNTPVQIYFDTGSENLRYFQVCSFPMENPGSSSKRQKRTQQVAVGEKTSPVSGLWLEDNTVRVGLCFKGIDELKKAVDWWSIKRQKNCLVREIEKDLEWKKGGLFEITECSGPHTCYSDSSEDFEVEFLDYEIERVVRVHPTLSTAELDKWWKEKFDYALNQVMEHCSEAYLQDAKEKAIKRVFGDWDQSFRFMPKLIVFPDYYEMECLVRKAGSTSQKEEFDSCMTEIKEKNPEAWKWFEQFPPHQWALAHDSGRRYGVMKINTKALFAVCKRFPKVAMAGGVMLLFGELRDAFEESFSRRRGSLNRGEVYTEHVMEKLTKDSVTFVIKPLERDAYQVSTVSKKKKPLLLGQSDDSTCEIVQLNDSTCTCGEFQRKKFPCLHARAVCDKLKINPLQYVDDCYTTERYYKTYAANFNPVSEVSAWPEASGVPTLLPPPKVSVEKKNGS